MNNVQKNHSVLLVEIAGRGGICHYTYNLAQELSKTSEVSLITSKNYELKNKKNAFATTEIFNRFKTNPFFVLTLTRMFKGKNTGIIHFQLSQHPLFVSFLVNLAKFCSRAKIIVTSHNVISHEYKKLELGAYRNIYRKADKIIVHSLYAKDLLKSHFGILEKKISVIPHGNYLFLNEDTNSGEKEYAAENIVLFFGYIRRYKGLMYLIRAFAKVKAELPDAKLLIIGKPVEPFAEYQKEIDKLHLDENVEKKLEYIHFSRIKEYFERAALVALPYLDITQSGIMQLAYAFGKPVVATDVGGLREYVENGKNGFIVPLNDIDAMAKKIITIIKNNELQKSMGEYSLKLAHTKYSWSEAVFKTLKVYEGAYA